MDEVSITEVDVIAVIDRLEKWIRECRKLKPDAERLIGKRKREEAQGNVLPLAIVSAEELLPVYKTIDWCLTTAGRTSKLPAILFFLFELLERILTLHELEAHEYLKIYEHFVEYLERSFVCLVEAVTKKEIFLTALSILISIFPLCDNYLSNRLISVFFMIVESMFSACDHATIYNKQPPFLTHGLYKPKRFLAEIYRYILSLLTSKHPTTRIEDSEYQKTILHLIMYARKCHIGFGNTVQLTIMCLAEDDESLFHFMLSIVKCTQFIEENKEKMTGVISEEFYVEINQMYIEASICLLGEVFHWDENAFIDLLCSEETVCLEYWLRFMKTLKKYHFQYLDTKLYQQQECPSSTKEEVKGEKATTRKEKVVILVDEYQLTEFPSSSIDIPKEFQLTNVTVRPVSIGANITEDSVSSGTVDEEEQEVESENSSVDEESSSNVDRIVDKPELWYLNAIHQIDRSDSKGRTSTDDEDEGLTEVKDQGTDLLKEEDREKSVHNEEERDLEESSLQEVCSFVQRLRDKLLRRQAHKLLPFSPLPLIRSMNHFLDSEAVV